MILYFSQVQVHDWTVLLSPASSDMAIGRRFAPTLCQGVTLRIHFTADFSLNPERLFPEGDLRFGSR